ncbi:MAG: hypothetical protein V1886_03815 [archaeon]
MQEAENLVFYIFMQGDTRHLDSFYIKSVADFILYNAIAIEKEVFSFKEPEERELVKIKEPQKIEKYYALQILKSKNLEFKGFEMPFLNYEADILAMKEGKTIVIECGPCRLWKAISCLEADAELWITREDKQTELFTLTKGENWNSKLEEFKSRQKQELKAIKSPLDSL